MVNHDPLNQKTDDGRNTSAG